MTEIKKHQLDELSATDIVSYLSARASTMEEDIRRKSKQLTKAEELLTRLSTCFSSYAENIFEIELVKEAEQFLSEVE